MIAYLVLEVCLDRKGSFPSLDLDWSRMMGGDYHAVAKVESPTNNAGRNVDWDDEDKDEFEHGLGNLLHRGYYCCNC